MGSRFGNQDRLPNANRRARRNAARFNKDFGAYTGGITVNGDGKLTLNIDTNGGLVQTSGLAINLATTSGLQLDSNELSAVVQGVLAIDASGIKLDYGTGLTESGGSLIVDNTVFVPYTGATADVNLGSYGLEAKTGTFNQGILSTGTTLGYTIPSGAGTRLLWVPSKYAFRAGQVTGTQWDSANIANYSFACGYNTTAGLGSVAMGSGVTASGTTSVGMGSNTTASGIYSVAMGNNAVASATYSVAMGYQTTASGQNAFAMGNQVEAAASYSFAVGGIGTNAEVKTELASGAIAMGYATGEIGDPSGSLKASGTGAIAVGYANVGTILSSGDGSFVLGYASSENTHQATGTGSGALGQDVQATQDNAISIGKSFTNNTANRFMVGFGQADLEVWSGNVKVNGAFEVTGAVTFNNTLDLQGNLDLTEQDIVTDTTTGTKFGTSTSQKLGFFNATPVVRQAHIADADGTLADITTKFNTLLGYLETYGFLAAS